MHTIKEVAADLFEHDDFGDIQHHIAIYPQCVHAQVQSFVLGVFLTPNKFEMTWFKSSKLSVSKP